MDSVKDSIQAVHYHSTITLKGRKDQVYCGVEQELSAMVGLIIILHPDRWAWAGSVSR